MSYLTGTVGERFRFIGSSGFADCWGMLNSSDSLNPRTAKPKYKLYILFSESL